MSRNNRRTREMLLTAGWKQCGNPRFWRRADGRIYVKSFAVQIQRGLESSLERQPVGGDPEWKDRQGEPGSVFRFDERDIGYVPQTAHEGQFDPATGVTNQTKPLGAEPPHVVVYSSQWDAIESGINAADAYAQGEIARLKASVAKLESDGTEQARLHGEMMRDRDEAIGKAQAEIERLKKDAERLDWLEANSSHIRLVESDHVFSDLRWHLCWWDTGRQDVRAHTIRKVIDAAIVVRSGKP